MYVCICNNLTEGQVRQAARDTGERRCPKTVYRNLGCRPQCGRCLVFAGKLIAEEEEAAAVPVPPVAQAAS